MASNLDDAKELRLDLQSAHFNTRTTEILEAALDTYIEKLQRKNKVQDPMVRCIRAICVRELGQYYDYPFFSQDYLPDEDPDTALARMFYAERPHQDTDFDTVLAMCHG